MNIYLLRHGIAAPLGQENQFQDEERVLTPEGMLKMRKAAQGLKRLGVTFDRIVSSPLVRARQSADIVAEVLSFREAIILWEDLEPSASPEAVAQRLAEFRERDSVLLAGHQPSIGCLASYFLFRNPKVPLPFKKGAIFCVGVTEVPPQQPAELKWMLTSKMLRQIAEL
jgi:phosphohistidine phosphatase